MIATWLPYVQITLSIVLIILILLQHSEAGLGGALGGGDDLGGSSHTRRGSEKTIFNATVLVAVLFALSALLAL
jgi:preprotein translocase subunit SecG